MTVIWYACENNVLAINEDGDVLLSFFVGGAPFWPTFASSFLNNQPELSQMLLWQDPKPR